MTELYAAIAGVGTLLILFQLLGPGIGGEHEVHHDGDHDGDGLQLRSLRAIGVGLAAFGFTGLILESLGVRAWIVAPIAAATGAAGLLLTAWILMRVARLEEDASVHIGDTLGERGTVYIPIGSGTAGKVQVIAKGRTMEYRAVATEPLPTGTAVLVTGLQDEQTVEVERA
jgi:hypothetical protein